MHAALPPETRAAFGGDELRARIFYDKYAARAEDGQPFERTPDQMWKRIAEEIASVEPDDARRAAWTGRFRWLLSDWRMIPGGRIMTGARNPRRVTLANCYVLGSPEDSIQGIFETAHHMAETYKRGGGCGFDISTLRPSGTPVKNAALTSSGAVSFMQLFSTVTGTIGQLGRRGALMITLGDRHPDVLAFARVKRDLATVTFANISVRVSDAFLQAVEQDADWLLEYVNEADRIQVRSVIRARQLWDEIIAGATQFAEPGLLFWDTVQRGSTSEYHGMGVVSTNPCSEVPMGPWDTCTLANLNLAAFCSDPFTPKAGIILPELLQAVASTVRFLDNVLDYNADRHPLAAQREQSLRGRRIGVGFTGLADLLIQLGHRYDTPEAVALASTLFCEIKHVAYATSVAIAKEKGAFPAFDPDRHLASPFFADFPDELLDAIRTCGLRNVALLTVPPVGSGAALAGVTSGIEPVFALQYIRRSESLSTGEFTVEHPLVTRYRALTGTQDSDPLPPAFVTAHEIDPRHRIAMQAAIQQHVDMGISVTINLPRETTPDTVATIYREAWNAGCKGITVYREGSRDGILLTKKEAATRQHGIEARLSAEINRMAGRILPPHITLSSRPTEQEVAQLTQAVDALLKTGLPQLQLIPNARPLRPRPTLLRGITLAQPAPEGNIQCTVNEVDDEPFELICHGGKAGSDINAWVQALARVISILLRLQRLPSQVERLQLIIDQLEGIAGSRSIGFGLDRVRSGPDGIAQAFRRYLTLKTGPECDGERRAVPGPPPALPILPAGGPAAPIEQGTSHSMDNGNGFCPRCGGHTLSAENGCSKCPCGFQEC